MNTNTTTPETDDMAAAETMRLLVKAAEKGLARRKSLRAMFVEYVEKDYRFSQYDELIEADGAAETWTQIMNVAANTEEGAASLLAYIRRMTIRRMVCFTGTRSSSAASNATELGTHSAWAKVLDIIEEGI